MSQRGIRRESRDKSTYVGQRALEKLNGFKIQSKRRFVVIDQSGQSQTKTYESSSLAPSSQTSQFPQNPSHDFPRVSQDDDARKLDEYLKVFHCVFDEYLIKHKRSRASSVQGNEKLGKGLLLFVLYFLFSPKNIPFPNSRLFRQSVASLGERIKQNQLTLPGTVFCFQQVVSSKYSIFQNMVF